MYMYIYIYIYTYIYIYNIYIYIYAFFLELFYASRTNTKYIVYPTYQFIFSYDFSLQFFPPLCPQKEKIVAKNGLICLINTVHCIGSTCTK